jgi:FkbM family methyltransferase
MSGWLADGGHLLAFISMACFLAFLFPVWFVQSSKDLIPVKMVFCPWGLVVDAPFWQRHRKSAEVLVRQAQHIISFQNVRFYVPLFPTDWIQRVQVESGDFYEAGILKSLAQCVPFGSVVFDIGSNVGNHAIYWGVHRRARRVYAFEPVPATFQILRKNIELNRLQGTIIPVNLALSYQRQQLSLESYNVMNIGGARMQRDGKGAINAIALDSFQFCEGRVDFVKIDVEGFECNVIQGALEFLRKYHPRHIFIEIFPRSHRVWINSVLASFGYRLNQSYNGVNFLYRLEIENMAPSNLSLFRQPNSSSI